MGGFDNSQIKGLSINMASFAQFCHKERGVGVVTFFRHRDLKNFILAKNLVSLGIWLAASYFEGTS